MTEQLLTKLEPGYLSIESDRFDNLRLDLLSRLYFNTRKLFTSVDNLMSESGYQAGESVKLDERPIGLFGLGGRAVRNFVVGDDDVALPFVTRTPFSTHSYNTELNSMYFTRPINNASVLWVANYNVVGSESDRIYKVREARPANRRTTSEIIGLLGNTATRMRAELTGK